ncbi:virulence factor TspB C-terminal domain-related protein [Pseudomonas sp. NCHU5208]|uniref:virulence factor TspB C-terminal domain-related protein n=1 Tax=unclassified Pseudomonas TaxID=196821 RepID=UPI003F98E86C
MRLIKSLQLLLALFFVGFGPFVFAAQYKFFTGGQSRTEASSAAESCRLYASYNESEYVSNTAGGCTYRHWQYGQAWTQISRSGDSCSNPDDIYDDQRGDCSPPPPECPVGDMFPAKGSDSPVVNSGGRNYVVDGGPPSVCYNQCTYNGGDYTPATSCYFVSGSTTTGFCNYVLKSTGGSCGADSYELSRSGDSLNPPDTPDVPPSDPDDPGCGDVPGYVWSGTTCVKDPGNSDGPGDGSDGDGSGDGNGNGDGDGNSDGGGSGNGDGSGDGNGDGDGSDGDGNGSGEGNGEGEGQCDPATDPNKCGQPSVGGESCDAELKCEGDVIQCAILRKNKEQLCQWTYDANVKKQIADEMAGEAYQLKEESIPVAGLFSEAVNKGRWLPQSCPPPENFTVMGRSYSFSWEPACRFAQAIGPLIVALASIFFAVSIGRGIKGS